MSNFGELTPAIWEKSKNQISNATFITTNIINVSSIVQFVNAHDYELGMRLYFNNMLIDDGSLIHYFTGWGYVTSITSFTATLDIFIPAGGVLSNPTVTGYIALERATIDPNYIETVKIVHESVLTGKRHTITRGSYSNFNIMVNLLRMSTTNRVNLSRLLSTSNGSDFLFFPHVDKSYIKNSSFEGVEFNMNINFKYVSSIDFRDRAMIQLVSQEYTDITQNIG